MKKWLPLIKGDIIDIIAPGYTVESEVITQSVQALEKMGYIARVPQDFQKPEYFHSNSDKTRFQHLKKSLLAKDSRAIWCLRGGYGSNRLIPFLQKMKIPAKNKLLIGVSDVTSLHLFLNQKWKWSTLHGTLLDRLGKGTLPADILAETMDVITGEKTNISFSGLKPLNKAAEKVKSLKGSVLGGNFVVLQTSLGTDYQINLKNKFLFIEEYGERGYRVDRMLEHFKQARVFEKGCLGVLVGQIVGGNEADGTNRVTEAIQRFADENIKIPVWSGLESGHGERLRPLPLGTEVRLVKKKDIFQLEAQTGCKVVDK
jgi:muramoyltetrapeptide carboxypeptidase